MGMKTTKSLFRVIRIVLGSPLGLSDERAAHNVGLLLMMFVRDLGTVDTDIRVWKFPVQLRNSRPRASHGADLRNEGAMTSLAILAIFALPDWVTQTFFLIDNAMVQALLKKRHLAESFEQLRSMTLAGLKTPLEPNWLWDAIQCPQLVIA